MNKINCIIPFRESFLDYPCPESSCISIYFIGCEHNCSGCSNPQFQDINYKDRNTAIIGADYLLNFLKRYHTKNITLLGGDCCHPKNIDFTKELLIKNKEFNICIYTGYSIDYIKQNDVKGFKFIKCGKYISSLKQISEKTDDYMTFASTNQILYDSNYNPLSIDGQYKF